MSSTPFLTASFTRGPGGVTALWRLTLDQPAPAVWDALTKPALLAQWLAPGEIELREGGLARLDFGDSGGQIDSLVTCCEPHRRLEYSWSSPGEPLRNLCWRLEAPGSETALTLSLTVPVNEDVARAAAGWSAHLDMLQSALLGAPARFPLHVFKAARETYSDQINTLLRQPVAQLG